MKIERVIPPAPPPEIRMTFTKSEGWAVRAALMDYAERHPEAADRKKWFEWAKLVDQELRK